MKIQCISLLLWSILLSSISLAQTATISGYIQEKETGEKLIGATVFDRKSGKGTTTNLYGFYSLTLPKDSVDLIFSFVGSQPMKVKMLLEKDMEYNLDLSSDLELEEFEVVATQTESIQEETQMSKLDISMDKVKALPVLLGEKDIMKVVQLMPGVQSGSEGTSGIYVRGGGPDQNLMLLDGVPVYNASHLFGFFSVFNADAIRSVSLIKGGFPSRYGGRLSSVLDLRMKEGNMKKFAGEGSIGIISSRLTLEGPIKTDKTSFIISGRRTYLDLLARPLIKKQTDGEENFGYFFHDVNAKINHIFSKKSRLFLSGYVGDDKFYAKSKYSYSDSFTNRDYDSKEETSLKWGNSIFALRWNYMFSNKLFSNTTLTYSKYRFVVGFEDETIATNPKEESRYGYSYFSGINDWSAKIDFDYIPKPDHYIKFGISDTYHTFTPGVNQFMEEDENSSLDTTFGSQKQYAHELHAYIEDDIKLGAKLKMNPGLHYSSFFVNGHDYHNIEPRISARYLLSEKVSMKGAYTYMAQYLHLLTNPSIGLPTDLWVPVTEQVKPQRSHQVALGVASTIKEKYEISLEGYYKTMDNLIEYKDGISFLGSDQDWQEKVAVGKGWSYGAELLFEKKVGKTSGWIGYTLSWTERQFDELNFGEKFPYRYDRRHDIGVAVTHEFNDRWDMGIVWVYGTGKAVTLGLDRYEIVDLTDGNSRFYEIDHITSRNNYREPSYHRLDIGFNFHKEKKRGIATWNFGLYNVYSRQNPFYLFFDNEYDYDTGRFKGLQLKQYSIFPIIPSISYAFKF